MDKKNDNFIATLCKLEQIIFNLRKEDLMVSIEQTMKLYDSNFSYSYNSIISNLIYSAFYAQKYSSDLYLNYLEAFQTKEEEFFKEKINIIKNFCNYLCKIKSQESYYLIERMIEKNLISSNVTKFINSKYFAHYKTESENKTNYDAKEDYFHENYEELSKNDFELHKQFIKEGHNPNEIAKIIRNDELEKLQEMSSQTNFYFNQEIKPSIYERCDFINQKNVTLIDYAAFFGSVKCFKYLLMNGAKVINAGKYAVAGGNEEIIHLCEQNHSSFFKAYETAIEFHQNDIFKYIYENKLEKLDGNINSLAQFCINNNYEILSFLEEEGMKINDSIFNETA